MLGGAIGPGGITGGGGRPRGYASKIEVNPVGADLLKTGNMNFGGNALPSGKPGGKLKPFKL
jgi:hypothetical protein